MLKRIALGAILPVTLIIAFFSFRNLVKLNLVAAEIESCVVEYGNVEKQITTSGTVELEKQFTLLAPSTTTLKTIIAVPGQEVSIGDTLLVLDPLPVQKKLFEEQYQLEKLKTKKTQSSLQYDKLMLDQRFNLNTKLAEISRLQIEWEDQKALFGVGGSSESKVTQAQGSVQLAKDEYALMEQQNRIQLRELETTMKDIDAEISMKKMNVYDIQNQLKQMIVRAPVPGVVVEVNGEVGSMVSKDNVLVKISDLRTYKITGKINDDLSEKIITGGHVNIIIDKSHRLNGTIGNIRPIVDQGQVYFDIFPENKSYPKFRPNLNVEIKVIVAVRENTLRVKDGPFFDGSKKLRVYKMMGDKAVATEISTGLFNMEYVEILDGLQAGDEIVISDISSVQSMEEVEIK